MNKLLLIGPIIRNLKGFRKELILHLLDSGYDVTLVAAYKENEILDMDKRLHFCNVPIDRRGTSIFQDLKLIFRYAKILYDIKPNCVLTYTTKCSVYGGIVCSLLGVPYIVNNSGLYNKDDFGKVVWFVLNTLFKLGYTRAKCLMHQNSYEQEYLDNITHFKPKSILLPGSGVNLKTFSYHPYPPNNGKIILNYMARIVNIKGIYELIDAVKRVIIQHPELEIRLYGDFESEEYKIFVNQAEADGLIKYCGMTEDVTSVIEVCHGVVHPSYYEGMTNVILEHSAMGRPCLGSDIPGVKEGIEDGKTGFIFRPKDSYSLSDVLERFLSLSHEEREQMGIKARERMERYFDRQIVIDKYIQEIKNILY